MIEQVSDYIFRVESDSDADRKYVVDLTPDNPPQCTCVAWVMKRNRTGVGMCKHVGYAVDFMSADIKVKAQQEKELVEFDRAAQSLAQTVKDLL